MKGNIVIEVIFIREDKPLRIYEFSNFLYYIKILYSFLASSEEFLIYEYEREPETIINIAKDIAQTILQQGSSKIYYEYNLFRKNLKQKDLFIAKISKESPLSIVFTGIPYLIVAAFIISGGELEITVKDVKIRMKMTSLGEGIKKLKDVFRK